MDTVVPQQVVDMLLELGLRDNIEKRTIATDFSCLRPYEFLSRIHWQNWLPVCSNLDIEDHVAMLKAVVMAEQYAGWGGGSVAPGIWIYNNLEKKISFNTQCDIAQWVIDHSDNPWLPFGTQKSRTIFISLADIKSAADHMGSLKMRLQLEEAGSRLNSNSAQYEIDQQQRDAKVTRLLQKEINAAEHYLRKKENHETWRQMISIGESLDEIERLRLLIDYPHMPLLCFPADWGEEVTNDTLAKLDHCLCDSLVKRMAGKKSQPWFQLCVMLEGIKKA